jgi:hypothetical protein
MEQYLFTIKTNMPIPMLVYGDASQWAKYIRSAKQDDKYGASNIVLPYPGS